MFASLRVWERERGGRASTRLLLSEPEKIRELRNGEGLEGRLVAGELEDPAGGKSGVSEAEEKKRGKKSALLNLALLEMRRNVPLELGVEERRTLLAAETVTDGVVDRNFGQDGAVVEGDGEAVRDVALGGVVVVGGELRVLDALHL